MQACCTYLEDSLRDYQEAAKGFLRNEAAKLRPLASLHWAVGQQLCMAAVLGQPVREGTWEAARLSADTYTEEGDADSRAWAYASLAELWLLRLADPAIADPKDGDEKQSLRRRREAERQARHCATEMIKLVRSNKDAQVLATFAQIQRYVEWWSTPLFEHVVADRFGTRSATTRSWKKLGIVKLANELIGILEMRGPGKRAAWKPPALNPAAFEGPAPKSGAAKPSPAKAPPANTPAGNAPAGNAPPGNAPAGKTPAENAPAVSTIVAAVAAHEKVLAQQAVGQTTLAPAMQLRGNGTFLPGGPAFLSATAAAKAANGGSEMTFRIEMLPAGHGDCLWIEYGDGPKTSRVLVDCGSNTTYGAELRKRIEAQAKAERAFELFILTHIDDDHIGGGIPLLKEAAALGVEFGDVWFNGWKHLKPYGHLNARQGEIFSELTQNNRFSWNAWQRGGAIVLPEDGSLPTCKLPGGLVLTLLSPSVEKLKDLAPKWQKEVEALGKKPGEGGWLGDTARGTGSTDVATLAQSKFEPDAAENNGSSIAVLAEYGGKSVLLGADAHAPLLVATIGRLLAARGKDKLKLDAFKLPHHGSRSNLSKELLALVDCRNYLVSTNGKTFKHPDSEAIGRVIEFGGDRPRLLFNYESAYSGIWKPAELQSKHSYEAVYPQEASKPGLIVPV
jgi:beta-lactamase superfamily II metal-dependent hydrolase